MTDFISAVCPGCDSRVRAPLAAAGKTGRCPKCRAPVAIPGEGFTAADVEVTVPSPAAPADETHSAPPVSSPRTIVPGPASSAAAAAPSPPGHRVELNRVVVSWAAVVAVVLTGFGALFFPRERWKGTPAFTSLPEFASTASQAASKATTAREDFYKLSRKVFSDLAKVGPEDFPPLHKSVGELITDRTDMTFFVRIAPDLSGPSETTVEDSPGSPSTRAQIRFKTILSGRVTARYDWEGRGSFGRRTLEASLLSLKLEMWLRADAEYGFGKGYWDLERVSVTPYESFVQSEDPADKDLIGTAAALDMGHALRGMNGRPLRVDPYSPLRLVTILREARP